MSSRLGSHYLNTKFSVAAVLRYPSVFCSGRSSSVGIATDYGLDGPGSNPGGDEIFRPSRPALGPTQPPVKWVPVLSRGKVRPGPAADHSPPSSAAVMEEYCCTSIHPLGHTGPVTGSLYLYLLFSADIYLMHCPSINPRHNGSVLEFIHFMQIIWRDRRCERRLFMKGKNKIWRCFRTKSMEMPNLHVTANNN